LHAVANGVLIVQAPTDISAVEDRFTQEAIVWSVGDSVQVR
jgi:hypothetical protein